jgi:ABC-type arginine transport system ATPase subunit
MVFLNKRKTKIDSRCDACGTVNGTVFEIYRLWPHLYSWKLFREPIAVIPMSHGLLVIKEARSP